MGLFGKKDKKEGVKGGISDIPELPELPKLPELPNMDEFPYEDDHLPQLPRFPNNPLGDKFSQNTIKEAITGKKEDEEVFGAEDFPDEEEIKGMMPEPLQKSVRRETGDYETNTPIKLQSREVPQNFVSKNYITKKAEPIFIRIDKFEESMKIFQDIRTQISDIESLIQNIKEIKSKEEGELASWETEMQQIKNQIEKVNQDIFSRVE